jgi:hypothetical protein
MTDDEGVLGNLPRSRPGKRSEKRDLAGRPARTASKAAAQAEEGGKAAAKAPRASQPRTRGKAGAGARAKAGAAPRPEPDARQPADPPRPQQSGDAGGGIVRTAATVATTGVRVAGAVTREILRRLPRP